MEEYTTFSDYTTCLCSVCGSPAAPKEAFNPLQSIRVGPNYLG